jgi:hypothetical protein
VRGAGGSQQERKWIQNTGHSSWRSIFNNTTTSRWLEE